MDDNIVNSYEIIDSHEAARRLEVTANTLRQLVFRKALVPAGRAKRRSLFHAEEVNTLVDKRTRKKQR